MSFVVEFEQKPALGPCTHSPDSTNLDCMEIILEVKSSKLDPLTHLILSFSFIQWSLSALV